MIIQGKLRVPPLADRLVQRPRLNDLIAELVSSHSLVAVYAAAGAGKTTAVVEALPRIGLPVAWLTVDSIDAAPERLLAYLQAALGAHAPEAATVASDALRQGVSPAEAIGLLVEAAGSSPMLLVVDDVERIATADEALEVLSALVRYAPPTLHVILLGRRELPLDLDTRSALGGVVSLRPEELALTVDETAEVLAAEGSDEVHPETVAELTGGWVAGVLFESRRSSQRALGFRGESDGLQAYLASQVLEPLGLGQREFLIATSLLPEVTAAKARALGAAGAAGLLAELRIARLPVVWDDGGKRMRCHPRFREFLLTLLEHRADDEVASLRRAFGELLLEEGLYVEAVEELLRANAADAALRAAGPGFDAVMERLDFDVAERWLRALRPVAELGDDTLTRAELQLTIAQERYAAGLEHLDRLAALGERDAVAARSPRAAAMMAWCYWVVGRVDDARTVVELAGTDDEVAGVRYTLALSDGESRGAPAVPELTGGPLDALVLPGYWAHGRLQELVDPPASRWAAAVSAPWRISALRALGRTGEAIELCDSYDDAAAPLWLDAVARPELLVDLGLVDEARDAIAHGREMVRARGKLITHVFNRLLEVKLVLRLTGDLERGEELLRRLEERVEPERYPFLLEHIGTWSAMLCLLRGQEAAAAKKLRQAVRSMKAAQRVLELPTAAVFLAEAERRLGREDAAKKAADMALAAAAQQGSNHILLQALADYPAVAARQIALEESADGPWHGIGRALMAGGVEVAVDGRTHIRLAEFGQPAIEVDGVVVRPRIKKSYELLAYLASRPSPETERDELLDVLFGGRADESTRSYLRQATHRLREVLPGDAVLAFEGSRLRLCGDFRLVSDSGRVSELLAGAAQRQGGERLAQLLEALGVIDGGEYLAGVHSIWVDERREELGRVADDVRHEAAELLFAEGDCAGAKRLALAVVHSDPYREATWRVLMSIASATGDEAGVVDAYRMCGRAMSEIGMAVSGKTESLLVSLRR